MHFAKANEACDGRSADAGGRTGNDGMKGGHAARLVTADAACQHEHGQAARAQAAEDGSDGEAPGAHLRRNFDEVDARGRFRYRRTALSEPFAMELDWFLNAIHDFLASSDGRHTSWEDRHVGPGLAGKLDRASFPGVAQLAMADPARDTSGAPRSEPRGSKIASC